MVRDLASSHGIHVVVVDRDADVVAPFEDLQTVTPRVADLVAPNGLEDAIADCDLVVGAVPGPMGFDTVRRVIEAGKDIVDISFFEQDAFELDDLAKERGVTVVVDAGVAPGASNLLLGHAESTFERLDRFACYVGGLPAERHWPWQYSAPFSPIDVLAEYTRPARLRESGRDVVRPALSGVERLEFPGLGTLEAFETDGLRSILLTSKCPNLVEKTIRYPGHRDQMELLRAAGFFSEEPIELRDGLRVRPLDVAAALLFPQWQLGDSQQELTVMKVEVEGIHDGRGVRRTWNLLDRTAADGTSSMARTTGYTCTAVTRLVADGLWKRPGVAPPEYLGSESDCFDRVFADLQARGVVFERLDEDLVESV
ncbi:MAG: saccharopine dehydrogenase NADP-binding domain-containing protein [Thermoanaerobaculia bacterium]|nr:saccharopine dehydrogenase NADP-binding domain-containing protein [Thermoanaerobaculia bacterium]